MWTKVIDLDVHTFEQQLSEWSFMSEQMAPDKIYITAQISNFYFVSFNRESDECKEEEGSAGELLQDCCGKPLSLTSVRHN